MGGRRGAARHLALRPRGVPLTARRAGLEAVAAERVRRRVLARALAQVLAAGDGLVSPGRLRRHLAMHFGQLVARSCTFAELAGGVARAGGRVIRWEYSPGGPSRRVFAGVTLLEPRRRATAARWNTRLDADGLDLVAPIRRPRAPRQDPNGHDTSDPRDPVQLLPPGVLYRRENVWRQSRDRGIPLADTRNDDGTRGRPGRHMGYLELMAAHLAALDSRAGWVAYPPHDRAVVESLVGGRTVREIAELMGLTRYAVHAAIKRHQRAASVSGPGPGR
jgi:hypothetical protein